VHGAYKELDRRRQVFHCHIQAHMDYGFKALFRYGY